MPTGAGEGDAGSGVQLEIAKQPYPLPAMRGVGPEDLLRAFLDGRSADTLRAYESDLRDFSRFLGVPGPKESLRVLVTQSHGAANALVLEYRAHLTARGLSPATIGRRLAAVRSAVKVAKVIGLIPWTIDVQSPKVTRYRDTRGPGASGWAAIRVTAEAYAERLDPHAVRDHAIARLMRGLGLRSKELVGIDVADVELAEEPGTDGSVWVVGKGKLERERLTVPAGVADVLRAWMRLRLMVSGSGPVFIRLDRNSRPDTPERLTTRSLRSIIPGLARKAGLKMRVRPHGLRHEAITTALERTNGNVRLVQRFSRHADPRTLLRYDDNRADGAGDVAKLLDEG